MDDTLISFETAVLAKQKGFDEETQSFYHKNGELSDSDETCDAGCEGGMRFSQHFFKYNSNKGYIHGVFACPTQSLLQRWLREVHNIHITLTYDFITYDICIFSPDKQREIISRLFEEIYFTQYETALEMGLQEALKLIQI